MASLEFKRMMPNVKKGLIKTGSLNLGPSISSFGSFVSSCKKHFAGFNTICKQTPVPMDHNLGEPYALHLLLPPPPARVPKKSANNNNNYCYYYMKTVDSVECVR